MADYGTQVDAWGALVMEKGDLADELTRLVIATVAERGLGMQYSKQNVSLDGIGGESREHVVFQLRSGATGTGTVALRIAKKGAGDLELSWRAFEKNVGAQVGGCFGQSMLTFWGFIVLGAGLLTSIFGYGLCLVILGIAMIGSGMGWWALGRNKTTASAYQQFDTRTLVQVVDYALMKALATKGVAAQELRVLQKAHMEGIGNMISPDVLGNMVSKSL